MVTAVPGLEGIDGLSQLYAPCIMEAVRLLMSGTESEAWAASELIVWGICGDAPKPALSIDGHKQKELARAAVSGGLVPGLLRLACEVRPPEGADDVLLHGMHLIGHAGMERYILEAVDLGIGSLLQSYLQSSTCIHLGDCSTFVDIPTYMEDTVENMNME